MADIELFLRVHLAEGEVIAKGDEHRVISEASVAALGSSARGSSKPADSTTLRNADSWTPSGDAATTRAWAVAKFTDASSISS